MINDSLKYDSFYKFMTSLGVIVLLIPFVLLVYIFAQIDAALEVAQKYSDLKYPAKDLLELWMAVPLHLNENRSIAILVLAVDMLFGLGLTCCGLFGWYNKLQKFEDRIEEHSAKIKEIESRKLENDLKKASDKEIEDEKIREYADTTLVSEDDYDLHHLVAPDEMERGDSEHRETYSSYERNRAFVQEAIEVENECLDRVELLLGDDYELIRGVRLKNEETNQIVFFDAIAKPLGDKPFAFVEVHYVRDGHSSAWLGILAKKLERCFRDIGKKQDGTILGILIIVAQDASLAQTIGPSLKSPISFSRNWILNRRVISRNETSEFYL